MTTTIQSLERGLHILNIIHDADRPLSLKEIADHFRINRSSVYRLLSTLKSCGYVSQVPGSKTYRLGPQIAVLASARHENRQMETLLRPVLQQVRMRTGQNTHLAVLDGLEVIFAAVELPSDAVGLNIAVGTREPATVTALGKAILAFLPPSDRDRLLTNADMISYTDKSTTRIDLLQKDLEQIRKRYLAIDDEAYRSGILCYAAPVFNRKDHVAAAIGISGLRETVLSKARQYQEIVREAGRRASQILARSV